MPHIPTIEEWADFGNSQGLALKIKDSASEFSIKMDEKAASNYSASPFLEMNGQVFWVQEENAIHYTFGKGFAALSSVDYTFLNHIEHAVRCVAPLMFRDQE